jgi:hypothetical protein
MHTHTHTYTHMQAGGMSTRIVLVREVKQNIHAHTHTHAHAGGVCVYTNSFSQRSGTEYKCTHTYTHTHTCTHMQAGGVSTRTVLVKEVEQNTNVHTYTHTHTFIHAHAGGGCVYTNSFSQRSWSSYGISHGETAAGHFRDSQKSILNNNFLNLNLNLNLNSAIKCDIIVLEWHSRALSGLLKGRLK